MFLLTGLAVGAGTTGSSSCLCVSSFRNVSGGDFITEIKGIVHNYGSQYGLSGCAAHDLERPPLCDSTMPWLRGAMPAWCSESWCYVDALNCTANPQPSAYVQGMHYSYETCGGSNDEVFSDWYSRSSGFVHLCSVFSLKDVSLLEVADQAAASGPCGNTQTHLQVEGMVKAINALNDGLGFHVPRPSWSPSTQSKPLDPVYLTLTYNWTTYPFGQWEEVGRGLLESQFASCDLVVGMANGCPDLEIVQQALVANASRKMYVTGRGPRAVLTSGGDEQPYFFSSHLNSDQYAYDGLTQMYLKGARSLAVIYEDYGNFFFTGLGLESALLAKEKGYDVLLSLNLTREMASQPPQSPPLPPLRPPSSPSPSSPSPPPSLPPPSPPRSFDVAQLDAALNATLEKKPDVLLLAVRQPEWEYALKRLVAARPPIEGGHTFMGVWFCGASWKTNGTDCVGTDANRSHVTGGTQSWDTGAEDYKDTLLGRTYSW